jgi:hypothetical protein
MDNSNIKSILELLNKLKWSSHTKSN